MSKLIYSFQFVTRRNYHLINSKEDELLVRSVFLEVSKNRDFLMREFEGEKDLVTITIETTDESLSPAQISHYLESSTSSFIRNLTSLKACKMPSLWQRENRITTNSS